MSDLPLENGNEIPAWKTALSMNETVCREVSSEAFQRLLGGWVPLCCQECSPALLEGASLGGRLQMQVWFWP